MENIEKDKIFSIRLKIKTAKDFQKQAKDEHLKQRELFEKMFSAYTGKQLDAEQVPFNINLFRYDKINHQNLTKTIYNGYGFSLYTSDAFRYFGMPYYNDYHTTSNEQLSYNPYQATELFFSDRQINRGYPAGWKPFTDIEIEQFKKDFKIENPEDYAYLSAFRVFKDFNFDDPIILVNEHMYLVEKEKLTELFSYNSSDSIEVLTKDMPFAVSSVCKLKDISQIDKLHLDREYLNEVDVLNIKNVLNPTVTAKTSNIDEIIDRYSIL